MQLTSIAQFSPRGFCSPLLVAILLALLLRIPQSAAQSTPETDRLLEGELLEVAAGDLERATRIYEELIAAKEMPESVRARALLYSARCHRKRGQLDEARKLLERLVKEHADERKVVRQANVFLRELRTGKGNNENFDWLGELARNPEIQARVFDLAMGLVGRNYEEGYVFSRQLLALGSISVPVLEKIATTSRDESHRQIIGLILVRLGRFERFNEVLQSRLPFKSTPRRYYQDVINSIKKLPEKDQQLVAKAVESIPQTPKALPYINELRLHVGSLDDLAPALPSLEQRFRGNPLRGYAHCSTTDVLGKRVAKSPADAKVIASRLLETEDSLFDRYYRLLEQHAPQRLGPVHWRAALREDVRDHNASRASQLFGQLEDHGTYDALKEFAGGRLTPQLLGTFWERYVKTQKLSKAPAEWAAILRATNDRATNEKQRFQVGDFIFSASHGGLLHFAAEHNDGFVAEFAAFLSSQNPDTNLGTGYGSREAASWLENKSWQPSEAYVGAMEELLHAKNPQVVAIALEALSLAQSLSDNTIERLKSLASDADDDTVRGLAIHALLHHLEQRPELGPPIAELWLADSARKRTHRKSVYDGIGHIESTKDRETRRRRPPSPSHARHTWLVQDKRLGLLLYPHVAALVSTDAGRKFHGEYLGQCVETKPAMESLFDVAVGLKDPKALEHVVYHLRESYGGNRSDEVLAFMKSAATNAALDAQSRELALHFGVENLEQAISRMHSWFEWPAVLSSGDGLLDRTLRQPQFRAPLFHAINTKKPTVRWAYYEHAFKSRSSLVRSLAYGSYPLDAENAMDILAQGLADPATHVRRDLQARISGNANLTSVYLTVLNSAYSIDRLDAIEQLRRAARPDSIEPLTELLDDGDLKIRETALTALKSIRDTLKEKDEWKGIVDRLRKSRLPLPEQEF